MEIHYPIDVKVLEAYKLIITFDNNEQRIFDVAPYLNDTFFASLRNQTVFNSVKINPISIEWVGGIDICPDELYYNGVPV